MALYDTHHLAMLLSREPARIETLSVEEIDSELQALDTRVTAITNSMRTVQDTLIGSPRPLAGLLERAVAPVLHLRSVFALTGLKQVLDSNLALRNKLIYARSKVRAMSALS